MSETKDVKPIHGLKYDARRGWQSPPSEMVDRLVAECWEYAAKRTEDLSDADREEFWVSLQNMIDGPAAYREDGIYGFLKRSIATCEHLLIGAHGPHRLFLQGLCDGLGRTLLWLRRERANQMHISQRTIRYRGEMGIGPYASRPVCAFCRKESEHTVTFEVIGDGPPGLAGSIHIHDVTLCEKCLERAQNQIADAKGLG